MNILADCDLIINNILLRSAILFSTELGAEVQNIFYFILRECSLNISTLITHFCLFGISMLLVRWNPPKPLRRKTISDVFDCLCAVDEVYAHGNISYGCDAKLSVTLAVAY